MVGSACPRCAEAVGLLEGRPVVGASGAIALWHKACWAMRDEPIEPVPMPAPVYSAPIDTSHRFARAGSAIPFATRRRTKWIIAGASLAAAAAIGLVSVRSGGVATSYAKADIAEVETPHERVVAASHEIRLLRAWVPTAIEAKYPMPTDATGLALEDRFPTLHGWVHPVTKSAEHVPVEAPRQFGVGRIGIETPRPECGLGHCGIDLDGPRGRALVSVADGTVVRVERDELGTDKISGRYVRIAHGDGTFTSYFHMDDVADGLEAGSHVKAGQYVGTLGATAVYSAPPHLHFALEIPRKAAPPGIDLGDDAQQVGDTIFIDPAPFLARAAIIPLPADLDQFLEKPDASKPPSIHHHERKPGT